MDIMMIIGIIIGAAAGGVIGWLVKMIKDQIKINKLEKQVSDLKLDNRNLQDKLEQVAQKLHDTQALLKDTLSAIEVLKAYKAIDQETQKDIEDLKNTLDNEGETTPETVKKYRNLIDKINQENKSYNEGRSEARG